MKQYDIVLVGLDPTLGAEMKKTRPCIVISPDEMNDCLRTILVAPLTTNTRAYPWRVAISFQRKRGMIALDQLRTIDRGHVIKRLGSARSMVVSAITAVLDEMLVQQGRSS
jgi:mRNA interferase MazF